MVSPSEALKMIEVAYAQGSSFVMKHDTCAVIIRPCFHDHVRIGAWQLMQSDEILVTAIALSYQLSFFSSLGVVCPLPAAI